MNHAHDKFLTTGIVFVTMLIGVFIASQFKEINLGALNMALLLVNALLLLIIFGVLLQIEEHIIEKTKKRS